jgi:hypothetical protein
MAWYDYIPSPGFQFLNALDGGTPFGIDPNGRGNVPQIQQNPFMGDWKSLIGQLQTTASGNGPSLAGNAYKQAANDQMHAAQSMAAGGSAGGARQAQMMMGRTNQGIANGYSNARLQEQLAAQQMLSGALQGAGNAWFQPQAANLSATLGSPTNLQKFLSILSAAGPIAGAMGA